LTLFTRFAGCHPDGLPPVLRGGCILDHAEGSGVSSAGPSSPTVSATEAPRRVAIARVPAQPDPLWDDIRNELRRATPDFKFQIWIEPLELAAVCGHTLYVRAPDHILTSVAERYLPLLRRAAAARFDGRAVVEIVDTAWQPPEAGQPSGPCEPAAAAAAGAGLNPKYTFEQFVIGGGNRFAHAAALAVAELPSQAYNPLFLHGPPGVGKTHLLHAIGDYVGRYGVGMRVRYATIEEFTSEFVEALREHRTAGFKESFRGADVVLIDDVQFLAGRAKTREEFFHTFNVLLDSGRQLVMTSDRGPEKLPDLETRLTERFRSGLVVELETPDLDVRRAILTARAQLDGVNVTDEVLDEIALRVTSSVRALEGALIRIVAYASLKDEPATRELAQRVLKRVGAPPSERTTVANIVEATATEFGLEKDALLARDRRPTVALARQLAMYVARELTPYSLPEIGRRIGNRNHTTVLHAVNRVRAMIQTDPEVEAAVDNLLKRLAPRGDRRDE
jgi:chromosomal replication initiator protein